MSQCSRRALGLVLSEFVQGSLLLPRYTNHLLSLTMAAAAPTLRTIRTVQVGAATDSIMFAASCHFSVFMLQYAVYSPMATSRPWLGRARSSRARRQTAAIQASGALERPPGSDFPVELLRMTSVEQYSGVQSVHEFTKYVVLMMFFLSAVTLAITSLNASWRMAQSSPCTRVPVSAPRCTSPAMDR